VPTGATVAIGGSGDLLNSHLDVTEIAAPAAPSAGSVRIYAKTGSGELCSKSSGGTETCMSAGGGGGGVTYADVAAASLAGF